MPMLQGGALRRGSSQVVDRQQTASASASAAPLTPSARRALPIRPPGPSAPSAFRPRAGAVASTAGDRGDSAGGAGCSRPVAAGGARGYQRRPGHIERIARAAAAAALLSLCANAASPRPLAARPLPPPPPPPASRAAPAEEEGAGWGEGRGRRRGPPVGGRREPVFAAASASQSAQHRRKKQNSWIRIAAEKVGPSVVRLDTERDHKSKGPSGLFSRLPHTILGGAEEEERGGGGGGAGGGGKQEKGQGSGLVLDGARGTIVTNAHVVKGADRVRVTFKDGRSFEGAVRGADETTDLALVQIEPAAGDNLPAAVTGDSNTLEVGDWVIAVGNPFGLDNTITLGIISNLHRTSAEVGIPDKRLDFLQTDCAINPGNSGGPLLNEFGEVIAINTAIRADAEGIGFAIPINQATRIAEELAEGRPMRHAYIGVQMATLTPELARQYNSDPATGAEVAEAFGVLVVKVEEGSPSEAAGLRFGDVIVRADGKDIRSTGELQAIVDQAEVGYQLVIRVLRGEGGGAVTLTAVTADMAAMTPVAKGGGARKKR